MAAATESDRKQRFINLLHELFQLDKPELDFGLYRIMHAKSDQLSRFIREDLAQVIEEAFAEQGEQQLAAMRQDIEEKRQQAEALGAPDPDSAPAVKQARAAYDLAKNEQSASADVYDHLYRFFSRYYDKGDFMSRRHHVAENDSRAAPYAVPYDGREVYLHWANKDQYYVKSSETLANYTFNLNEALKKLQGSAAQSGLSFDSVDSSLKVHCRVVDAAEGEHNDVKESSERFFIIHHDEPVRLNGADLVLQFEYRPDSEKSGQSGTWQKKRLQEAEEAIMTMLRNTDGVAAYRDGLATPAPTDKQKNRTLLGKYLQQYTARNTMDYFIHKDLSGFLSRELDFYIKNEILSLDGIDNAGVLVIDQQLKKIQVLRKIARQIVSFLAQIENFQKKLWLKKKFVTEVNYCITLDYLVAHKDLLEFVFFSESQRLQWKDLYSLNIDQLEEDLKNFSLDALIEWEMYRFLSVDTSLYSKDVKDAIIGLLVENDLNGVLFHAENFQSLTLMRQKLEKSFSVVYIDPPYNTEYSKIAYKNDFEHSSWLSLIKNGVTSVSPLFADDFSFGVAIDDYELTNVSMFLEQEFKGYEISKIIVNHHPQGSGGRLSRTHEYLLLVSDSGLPQYKGEPREDGVEERAFMRSGRGQNNWRQWRWKSFYALLVDPKTKEVVGCEEPVPLGDKYPLSETEDGYIRIYPVNSRGEERVWRASYLTGKDHVQNGRLKVSSTNTVYQVINHNARRETLFSNWTSSKFNAGTQGTSLIENLGLGGIFDYPKSIKTMEETLWAQTFGDNDSLILDYFGGSGTTAHATINLNRNFGGNRRYVIVEMGGYFDSVLKKRVQKAAYSANWENGLPVLDKNSKLKSMSNAFKYLRLESYDDTLNNLELIYSPQRDALMEQNAELRHDYILKYFLDVETRCSASLLNTNWFRDPENYTLKVKQPGSDESRNTAVDLVETFNWLIGLHVTHLDKPRTYVARFEREEDPELPEDQNTRLKAVSLRENEDGAYWIRQVEGHVRRIPGSDEDLAKVLVVWRKLTDDLEKDAAVLEALLAKYKIGTNDSEFDAIYINGPHGLNLTGNARSRVHSLEESFHARMWEGCNDDV